MINKELLEAKCDYIAKDLRRLQPYGHLTFDEIAKDEAKSLIVERLLERIITRAIDMNRHILSEIGDGTEHLESNEDTFLALTKHGVISQELAKVIAPSAGLQNRLVHDYNDTDPKIIFASVGKALEQYPRYCQAILEFMDK